VWGKVVFPILGNRRFGEKSFGEKTLNNLSQGQEWGDSNGEPWIALHGWLDNCGSFQTLAPFFAKNQVA
jgi:hypothetical protein